MSTKLLSDAARSMSRARKNPSGGRQGRKPGAFSHDNPRCSCFEMTLKRALARGRSREHQPFCPFYKP
jgi:hypothetical protein